MRNYELIEKSAYEVIHYQETHNRSSIMTWTEAYHAAQTWYDHTDLTSPYMLAACVLAFGSYVPVTASQIMEASKRFGD